MKVAHRADPAIWKTQINIHRRVQNYEDEEEDSSDEYDDDFDLNIPVVNSTKLDERSTPVSKRTGSPQTEPNSPRRKKSFSNADHLKTLSYNAKEGNTNHIVGRRQSWSSMSYPVRRYSLSSRNEDDLPALTPQEAIRLVMERNTYLSDTERTDDHVRILARKASLSSTKSTGIISVHSSSTDETSTNNTLGSISSHNRTAEGKRVLALKKKKIREDTHPTTSKNKNYHRKYSQDSQRSPSRQQGSPTYRLPSERRKEREAKQTDSRLQAESSQSNECPTPNDSGNSDRRTHGAEATMKKSGRQNDTTRGFGNVQVEVDDNSEKGRGSSNKSFQSASFFEKLSNTKSQKRPSSPAFVVDISENDYPSESESNWDGHEDSTQRPSNRSTVIDASHDLTIDSMLEKEDEKDDGTHSLNPQDIDDKPLSWKTAEDDGKTADEDWRNMSWKTAKTSKSVLSKYSKNSSVALWMKNMEEAESVVNIDEDDIYFFDAIQEAGRTSSSNSVSTSDGSESKDDPAVNTEEGESWRGKITNFVGYTIGALTGSREEGDDSSGEEDVVGTIPAVVTPEKPFLPSKRNHSMGSYRSTSSGKAVPSRELEIIRKCQALMTSQRHLMETREREAAQRSQEDIRLQHMEDAARAKVRREVIAYRDMMEGMGKGDKLAPLDRKAAAQDYDDRLSMGKTLEDQEMKNLMHERNMFEMDNVGRSSKSCGCSCTIM